MPTCKECSSFLCTTKALVLHLNIAHKYNASSVYCCGEKGCARKFTSLKAFQRHVDKHDITECDTVSENNPNSSLSDKDEIAHYCETENLECSNVTSDSGSHLAKVDFEKILTDQANAFVCKYYSKPSLARNVVQDIIDDTQIFLSDNGFMNCLKQKVMDALISLKAEEHVLNEIVGMFSMIQDPFSHLKTEHLRINHFMGTGSYIEPISFSLGKRLTRVKSESTVIFRWLPVTAQHIPLAPVLKQFLELPDALSSILDYMCFLKGQTDVVSNFIQGDLWKQKLTKFKPTDIVIPLFVYFDDFESNNPLGPHCQKVGGVYVSIACLPPEVASQLQNIFLSILFYSEDRKEFPIKRILSPLIQELNALESEGIQVLTTTGEVKVFFVMGLLLGDNLGVHQLCSFVSSFAFANFPCRFCKIRQDRMQIDVECDVSIFRDKINYNRDVLLDDQSLTGIKGECVFNEVVSFHITENLEGDVLHDFDEGVCHNIMRFVLINLTDAKTGCFKLTDLNRRIQLFDFGTYSALCRTKFCLDSEDLVKKEKLKLTGSEMQSFVRSFGVLVGDLIPDDNPFWHLYLCLQKLLDLVVAKSLPKSGLIAFKYYAKELGRQFLSFNNNQLTFKFHKIIWHYSSIIQQSGPVGNLTVRRFESKHRQLKLGSYANMSRINVLKSMAIKHQLGLCSRFLSKKSILSDIEVGSGDSLSDTFGELGLGLGDLSDDVKKLFPDLSSIFVPHWIDFKGSHFDTHSTVVIDIDDFGSPVLAEVKNIFFDGKGVGFLCEKLINIGFREHYHAFEVKRSPVKVFINVEDLADPLPLNVVISPRGHLFIILRYQL